MRDETSSGERSPGSAAPAPLPYQSPGVQGGSQWITDDGPGGKWLVGCLIVLGAVGAVVAAVGGAVWFLFTGF